MKFLVFFSINLPLVVWGLGVGTLSYANPDNIYYKYFFWCFVLLWVMYYIVWQLISSKDKVVSKPFILDIRYRIVITSMTLILFFAAFLMGAKILELTGIHGPDDARFIARSLPGFGFASRIVYWWPIVLAPFVLLYSLQRKSFLSYLLILCLFLTALFSGSKGGIIWLAISFLVSLCALKSSGYDVKKEKKIVFYLIIFSVISMAGIWVFLSEDLVSAFGGFLFRVTYGAVEGIDYVMLYHESNGSSFPYFSIQRPLEEIASTFRLIEKTYFSGDTGVYLARYFDRANDNAGYTISIVGIAFLEGGVAGLFFIFATLLLWIYLVWTFFRSKYVIKRLTSASAFIVYAHFLDWGFIDGILVFSILYVVLATMLLRFVPRFRLGSSQ